LLPLLLLLLLVGSAVHVRTTVAPILLLLLLLLQARRAAEREEARRRQVAAKEAFMTLLEETMELEPGDSYDRAARLLNHDGRWKVRLPFAGWATKALAASQLEWLHAWSGRTSAAVWLCKPSPCGTQQLAHTAAVLTDVTFLACVRSKQPSLT
jgi:hypothetical protein